MEDIIYFIMYIRYGVDITSNKILERLLASIANYYIQISITEIETLLIEKQGYTKYGKVNATLHACDNISLK